MPSDVFAARTPEWVPKPIKQFAFGKLLQVLQGPYERYGLPANLPAPLTQHPTLNSDLLDFIRHGRVRPRPAVTELCGSEIAFADGTREAFDIVCACTGFWTVFPFFEREFIDYQHAEKIPLFRKMMHADYDNLYFIGLFQPIGCIWPLADHQARLACLELAGAYRRPSDMAAAIRHELEHPHYAFGGGQRHAVEVDYLGFRADLAKELKSAGVDIGKPPPKRARRELALTT
jgi:hypothetical protein